MLVWASMESLQLFLKGRKIGAAALLALIINIKLIPLAVLALYIYKGAFKTSTFTILFVLLALLLPGIVIGFGFNTMLLNDWYQSLTQTNSNSIMEDYGRQSLSSFIPAMLMDTPIQFNIKRNIANLSPQTVNYILNLARLLLLIIVTYLLGKPFRQSKNKKEILYAFALVGLCTPLFFPHQGKYAFFYLLPAYTFVFDAITHKVDKKSKRLNIVLAGVSVLMLSLSTDGLIGRHYSDLCEYLNLLTLGSLSLLVQLALLKPQHQDFEKA